MDLPAIISTYASTIGTFGILGCLIYDRYVSGTNDVRAAITRDYQERRQQQDARIKDLEDKLESNDKQCAEDISNLNIKFTGLVTGLEATLKEKEKNNASLVAILQGRNPELVALLEQLKVSNEKIMEFMTTMHTQNKKEMQHQTQILETQEKREKGINLMKGHNPVAALYEP